MNPNNQVIDRLLTSEEPSIRWKLRVQVLGEDPVNSAIQSLQAEIKNSPRIRALVSLRDANGRITAQRDVYAKWKGAHWVLAALADIGYPPGDDSLVPLRDQVLDRWLATEFFNEFEATTKSAAYRKGGVPLVNGRYRSHASMQGNALYSITRLGLADERCDELATMLLRWQWPDGGWNCDKNPSADTSSFMETLLPMCGLAVHADRTGNAAARDAADRAAEVFLQRRLFRRRSNGGIIHPSFSKLRYPRYWYYDVLGGLKGIVEVGEITDPRCAEALDLLQAKRLPGGGWPAEVAVYSASPNARSRAEYMTWGGTGARHMNEWVTVEALAVLAAAGRL